MLSVREIYLALVVVQLALSSALLVYVLGRRRVPGGRPLAALVATCLVWMVGIGLSTLSPSAESARFWFEVRGAGLYLYPSAFLTVALVYTSRPPCVSRAALAAIWGLPVLCSLLHWAGVPIFARIEFTADRGLWLWEQVQVLAFGQFSRAYLYVLLFGGVLRLLLFARHAPLGLRRASMLVAFGGLGPLVISLARTSRLLGPFGMTMLIPVVINGMCATIALAVFRYRWLDVSPLARGLLDAVPDPVFVQGADRRFLLVNDAWCKWSGRSAEEVIGVSDEALFPPAVAEPWRRADAALLSGKEGSALDLTSHQARNGTVMITHRSLYRDPGGEPLIVGVMRDVTDLERVKGELEAKVRELQVALDEVKTLEGFLPICMYCKKIRDDGNYWTRLEEYLAARTDAVFSHGVCPECCERALADYGLPAEQEVQP